MCKRPTVQAPSRKQKCTESSFCEKNWTMPLLEKELPHSNFQRRQSAAILKMWDERVNKTTAKFSIFYEAWLHL